MKLRMANAGDLILNVRVDMESGPWTLVVECGKRREVGEGWDTIRLPKDFCVTHTVVMRGCGELPGGWAIAGRAQVRVVSSMDRA